MTKSSTAGSTNSKKLQKTLTIYAALGIFCISAIVAIASIIPFYRQLIQQEQRNLLFAVKTRTLIVEQFLSKAKDVALQITSRTRARQQLEKYNQGQLPLTETVAVSNRILADALNQSSEVVGITRLAANGTQVALVGLPIPRELWAIPSVGGEKTDLVGPIALEGEDYLVVGAAIVNPASERVGTDLVLFKITPLQELVEDYTGLGETGETVMGSVRDGEVRLFFSLRNDARADGGLLTAIEKAVSGETGIVSVEMDGTKAAIAFGPIEDSNWGLAVKMDGEELYREIDDRLARIAVLIVVFSLLGAAGMVLLLRPLAGAAIVRTEGLEKQVEEHSVLVRYQTEALEKQQRKSDFIQQALEQMEELRFSSREVAEQTHAVGGAAKMASSSALEGTDAVEETLDTMMNLKESVEAIARHLAQLDDSAVEIGSITRLVSDFAKQTNMLALNAAVEAARAGEYGKGFSVVAAEIRKLANQSRLSASKINTQVANIQTAIDAAAIATDGSIKNVNCGVDIAQKTTVALMEVRQAINEVVLSSQEISRSTGEQAAAIQEVVAAINGIDEATENKEFEKDFLN